MRNAIRIVSALVLLAGLYLFFTNARPFIAACKEGENAVGQVGYMAGLLMVNTAALFGAMYCPSPTNAAYYKRKATQAKARRTDAIADRLAHIGDDVQE